MTYPQLTEAIAQKVLTTVDAGLSSGLGTNKPGMMCVEAAVCFALGLPHGDNPPCVGEAVRQVKIRINDSNWSSIEARAKGMRRVAIAQLGSDKLDQRDFLKRFAKEIIRQIVPMALRAAASLHKDSEHTAALQVAANLCEMTPTKASAAAARKTAAAAATAVAVACAAAAVAVACAADAVAYAYADAADAYADAEKRASIRDQILSQVAEIVVKILTDMKCEGCQWLALTEAA